MIREFFTTLSGATVDDFVKLLQFVQPLQNRKINHVGLREKTNFPELNPKRLNVLEARLNVTDRFIRGTCQRAGRKDRDVSPRRSLRKLARGSGR